MADAKTRTRQSLLLERWSSDGLEVARLNGEVIRMDFVIDAFDREIFAWTAVSGTGTSGSDVRGMMLDAV